jgi:hypothetical protein
LVAGSPESRSSLVSCGEELVDLFGEIVDGHSL